jgi:hypothetical protein
MREESVNASENTMPVPLCKWNSSGRLDRITRAQPRLASALHYSAAVAENSTRSSERRGVGSDRRKQSRGGRRATDPRTAWRWRRLAFLFAAYAVLWSLRSLPETVKRYVKRTTTPVS